VTAGIDRQLILVAIVVTFTLVAIILVWVLVGSSVIQRRRYLRAREHLGGRLLAAQDEERAAIARELHDDTVQRLISLTSRLRAGQSPQSDDIVTRLDNLVDDLRGLARGIHPTLVDHLGLDAALQELAVSLGERENMTVDYTGPAAPDDLTPRERLALYRVAQEALGNAAHHAGVDRVSMKLSTDGIATELLIEDAGVGFDAGNASRGPGIGITSMQERLSILGGTLRVDGAPGKGTRVRAVISRDRRTA
jgi:two-component system sensor histidine kinase UhpB